MRTRTSYPSVVARSWKRLRSKPSFQCQASKIVVSLPSLVGSIHYIHVSRTLYKTRVSGKTAVEFGITLQFAFLLLSRPYISRWGRCGAHTLVRFVIESQHHTHARVFCFILPFVRARTFYYRVTISHSYSRTLPPSPRMFTCGLQSFILLEIS